MTIWTHNFVDRSTPHTDCVECSRCGEHWWGLMAMTILADWTRGDPEFEECPVGPEEEQHDL